MDQLNDTWLHSDENKNSGKLIQRFEQPLEDNKFIMISRCAVTPAGQASLGMHWDGVWPAGTIPGICSWAPNTERWHWSKPVSGPQSNAWSCCPREVCNDLPRLEAFCFRGKAEKAERPQCLCSAILTLLCKPRLLLQLPSPLIRDSAPGSPGIQPKPPFLFHPAASSKQLSLPPSLNSSFLFIHSSLWLCLPLITPSPLCPHRLTPAALWPFVFTLNFCQGPAQFCTSQHTHTERNVLLPSGKACGHWAWNLLLYLITLQNPLQGIINVWFLPIKYTLTSSHLPPPKT